MTISQGFWLQAKEVTRNDFLAVMHGNPFELRACMDCPVDHMSWSDAVTYANKMSRKHGLEPCYEDQVFKGLDCGGYRLPTEVEWEHAARAGAVKAAERDLDTMAWHDGNANGKAHPVGKKRANAWGLHDMFGNVSEWVHDWHGPYPQMPLTDPFGPATGSERSVRGGNWNSNDAALAPNFRFSARPQTRNAFVEFRLARSFR